MIRVQAVHIATAALGSATPSEQVSLTMVLMRFKYSMVASCMPSAADTVVLDDVAFLYSF